MLSERYDGTIELRIAARQLAASMFQPPPRITRIEPSLAPSESVAAASDTVVPEPVVAPLKQIAVQIKQPTNARTQFPRRMDVLATVLREPAKSSQQARVAPKSVARPRAGTAGYFPLRFRRQSKSPSNRLQRPVPACRPSSPRKSVRADTSPCPESPEPHTTGPLPTSPTADPATGKSPPRRTSRRTEPGIRGLRIDLPHEFRVFWRKGDQLPAKGDLTIQEPRRDASA